MTKNQDTMANLGGRKLATTYQQARSDVLAAGESAQARLASFTHPRIGRGGEPLGIDVLTIGPEESDAVVLIVSGTHGVEGYAGSALQRWWLENRAASTTEGVRVVLVHALNPFGFSWVRRVNENNVDLNRNFLDWAQPPPKNPDYDDIADLLVPDDWSEAGQQEATTALLAVAAKLRRKAFQRAVTAGQYDHPGGIYYGGTGPVWSHIWASENIPKIVGRGRRLCILDIHTGLGPWGQGELISHDAVGSPAYERGNAWWGNVTSPRGGESVSTTVNGDWRSAVARWLPNVEVTSVALEFGTTDPLSVMNALRADAWLHQHGGDAEPEADVIRSQVRAAFADDDPAWLAALIDRFDQVTTAATTALVSP